MKLFKGFSCCNAGSTQTIDTYYSSSLDRDVKPGNRKQDSGTIIDDSEKSTVGIELSYSVNADFDDLCESFSSEGATPTSADVSAVSNIFRSKPKSSYELMAQNSFQVASPTGPAASLENWGYPGHLSKQEYEVYVKFHKEVTQRSTSFQQSIFSFGMEEDEEYALCRWLRARKFDLKKVIQMVEEATELRSEAAKEGFYPDGSKALGVEKSIYYALYPELFAGYTKHGYPFYITKAGKAELKAIMCITSMKNLIEFHWHCMAHSLGGQMRRRAMKDKSFKRFEACSIVDLEGLSIMNAMEALNVLKEFTAIDQLCYPEVKSTTCCACYFIASFENSFLQSLLLLSPLLETSLQTLHRFIFINSPPAFSAVWRIIRSFIDPRTANKVEILAKKPIWQSRLLDLVGSESLPSDYGGTAAPLNDILEKQTKDSDVLRQVTRPVALHSASSVVILDLVLDHEFEVMELSALTRSLKAGTFTVVERRGTEDSILQVIDVKHSVAQLVEGEDEQPTRVTFPQLLNGPGEVIA